MISRQNQLKGSLVALIGMSPFVSGLSQATPIGVSPLDACNVVWETPSRDMHGSMPIGNGDLAANVWVEPNGDLLFYLSKSDAWSGSADALMKLGRIRIRLDQPFVQEDAGFKQELDLKKGRIVIESSSGDAKRSIFFWIDANQPVVNVEIEGTETFQAEVQLELWRTQAPHNHSRAANDVVMPAEGHTVRWFHRNEKSCFVDVLENQHLGHLTEKYSDPLIHLTYGGLIAGNGLETKDASTLVTGTPTKRLHVRVHARTAQTETPEAWIDELEEQRDVVEKVSLQNSRKDHEGWWSAFWNRSWIFVKQGDPQVTPPAESLVPANDLNFRFGVSHAGGEKFAGQFGRATLLKRALGDDEIVKLAASRSAAPGLNPSDILYRGTPARYSELDDSAAWTDSKALTFETWILPAAGNNSARILDKTLPGSNEGLLFDAHPGNSLRLIIGDKNFSVPNCLKEDQWNHVAVVVDAVSQRIELYLDGISIAGQGTEKTLDGANAVTRAYVLQRWIQAGAGRGAYPIKFNGSLFNVDWVQDGKSQGPDARRWGGCYWFQNTREPYWAMLASGDYDHMEAFWKMYRDAVPLLKDRTQTYFDHEGIFCSETMYPWGLNRDHDFGKGNKGVIPTNPYIRYYWDSGNELSMMMLDTYAHTQDDDFAKHTLIPIADEVVKFYDQHHPRRANGKVHFTPGMSLETWHVAEDPLPVIVGLQTVLTRLLALPKSLSTPTQRANWTRFLAELPDLPFGEAEGKKWIEPARTYSERKNSENPELYAVFPYRTYALGQPDLEVGRETWRRRRVKGTGGWRQDAIQAAVLGLTAEAKAYVVTNASERETIGAGRGKWPEPRFPAFWGPNFDWTPDQCQGSVTMIALQRMLMQCDAPTSSGKSGTIRLLPAWPMDWDVAFKLHAPQNTVVEGRVENGKILDLIVTPASRKSDVVVMEAK